MLLHVYSLSFSQGFDRLTVFFAQDCKQINFACMDLRCSSGELCAVGTLRILSDCVCGVQRIVSWCLSGRFAANRSFYLCSSAFRRAENFGWKNSFSTQVCGLTWWEDVRYSGFSMAGMWISLNILSSFCGVVVVCRVFASLLKSTWKFNFLLLPRMQGLLACSYGHLQRFVSRRGCSDFSVFLAFMVSCSGGKWRGSVSCKEGSGLLGFYASLKERFSLDEWRAVIRVSNLGDGFACVECLFRDYLCVWASKGGVIRVLDSGGS